MISLSDAIVKPRTVMIILLNTLVAKFTMFGSCRLFNLASGTVPSVIKLVLRTKF